MGQPVMHFEIGCRNREKSAKFYSTLFGWKTEEFGPALMIDTGNKTGIQGHFNSLSHEPHHYVTFYIQVEDIKDHLNKIEKLGGKTMIPKTEVPGAGHFAWFSDLDGNCVGLWTPMQVQ